LSGKKLLQSLLYVTKAMPHCRRLLEQTVRHARSLAFENPGSNIAARMAMIAITTSNSISVKAVAPGLVGDGSRCILMLMFDVAEH
jgi:hypothetical protein